MSTPTQLPVFRTRGDVPTPPSWSVHQIQDAYVLLPTGPKYDSKTCAEVGEIPVLDQSLDGVLGYHSGEAGVVASREAPVVTFANHTCAMRLVVSPFSVIQNVFPLRGKPSVCTTRYLIYATRGRIGSTEYKGHHPEWRSGFVPLPPLRTQRKIATVLSAYDDLIENNNRRIKILEEMAQRIYREWFVDFRYPGHEGVPLVESELGLIPEGWSAGRVGDGMAFLYGKALKAADRRCGPVEVFGSSGVVGHHDLALDPGPGIVVGRKGNVGAVHWSDGPFYPIDTTYWVRTELPLIYCFHSLRGLAFVDAHAAVPGLNRDHVSALPLIIPDPKVSARFELIAAELFMLRRSLADAARALVQARDLLLPRLVSGEVDVSDLDIEIPEAA